MTLLGYLSSLPFFGLHLLCLPGSNASDTKTKKTLAQDYFSLFSQESEAVSDKCS